MASPLAAAASPPPLIGLAGGDGAHPLTVQLPPASRTLSNTSGVSGTPTSAPPTPFPSSALSPEMRRAFGASMTGILETIGELTTICHPKAAAPQPADAASPGAAAPPPLVGVDTHSTTQHVSFALPAGEGTAGVQSIALSDGEMAAKPVREPGADSPTPTLRVPLAAKLFG